MFRLHHSPPAMSGAPAPRPGSRPAARLAAVLAVIIAASTAAVGLVFGGGLPAQSAALAAVRVMPLGDSITGSPGCWRSLLWNRLQSSGYTNIDFVGTLGPQGCSLPHDGDNEGHGGALVTSVADQNQLPGWLSTARPDIVLMHFGTNDVWSARPPATILAAYSKLVDQMRASNASMRIVVAKIIPMNPSSCAACAQRVIDLNATISGWAAGKTTAQSPIVVVDQWTGFSTSADTYDGVHPNAAGDQKMSDRWYPALAALLGAGPSPSASVSPSASSSPSASPSASVSPSSVPGKSCSATYTITGSWQGGFQAEVRVLNTGTAATTGWRVNFTYTAGQTITQIWGGTRTQTGSAVVINNESWNGVLAPGANAVAGFLGSWTATNPVPAVTCVAL